MHFSPKFDFSKIVNFLLVRTFSPYKFSKNEILLLKAVFPDFLPFAADYCLEQENSYSKYDGQRTAKILVYANSTN